MNRLVVETRRGRFVESVHRVAVAVCDARGRLRAASGNPDLLTSLRSAAKPFQAIPVVADGAADRFAITPAELALICASHNSEPEQVSRVRALLERVGCTEADLACGPHRPLWRDMALAGETRGLVDLPRTPVASNCSGKHTGMLALARHHGWPLAGYHRPDHPVQRRCREEVGRWAGMAPEGLETATDGCGVVCFALPLRRVAGAFARLMASEDPAARRVVAAMMAHPDLVGGRGRCCTALMHAYSGRLLAKVGAEGVYGAALADRGLGVAVKVEDGHGWAAVVALAAVLRELGLDPPPAETVPGFAELAIRNTRGDSVGCLTATGRLTFD